MELKWHWALLVVLFGVSVGYVGRSVVSYVKAPNQSTLVDADYSAPPSSWVVYRFIQWADQALVYLRSKLVPPPYAALQLATSHFTSQALRLAAKLGIADLIGGGSKTVQELAEATGVREANLYRILRALAAYGYFAEEAPRVFRNTDLSAVLRKDHPSSVRNLVLVHHDHLHWGGSEGMLLTLTEGVAGWRLRLTGESLWDYYEDNRPENEVFNQAVAETNALRGTAVLDDYDFSHFKHVVDVGGGRGNFVSRLLRRYVNMTATIIDQQHVIDEAREEWKQRYGPRVTGYEDRLVLEAGDFMKAVPAGGDCYLLKGILSQLDDEQALVLLRNIREAMSSGGEQKLVLVEADFIRPHDTRQLNLALDLVSLAVYQGRGRTQDELTTLLATAGFTLRRAVDTRSPFTVVEAVTNA